jgi:hypothetical protein
MQAVTGGYTLILRPKLRLRLSNNMRAHANLNALADAYLGCAVTSQNYSKLHVRAYWQENLHKIRNQSLPIYRPARECMILYKPNLHSFMYPNDK